jgi:hypothetical protein
MYDHSSNRRGVDAATEVDSHWHIRAKADTHCLEETLADSFDHFLLGPELFRELC